MADYRDENTADEVNKNNLPDQVLVNNHMKLAHEDLVPETQRDVDANEAIGNLRDGKDIDSGTTARKLRDERAEESDERRDDAEPLV